MNLLVRTGATAVALLALGASAASAFGGREAIEVYRNSFTFTVNGQVVEADNFLLNDRAYVPLVEAAEAMGMTVTWDPATRTASARPKGTEIRLTTPVDPFSPVIDLTSLGLAADRVEAVGLETAGQAYVPRRFAFAWDQLTIADEGATAEGRPVLALNTQYVLKLYTNDGGSLRVSFVTAGLPDLTSTGERRVILVPAMPQKGFHWPYFLVLPSDRYREENEGHKRYLVVDTNNTGPGNSVPEMLSRTRAEVEGQRQVSLELAEELWSPLLMPALPRPPISYRYGGEDNTLFTHALDRDAATLHLKQQDPALAAVLDRAFRQAGFTVESLLHLDRQVVAMIDHAIAYLNQHGYNVEPQVFLVGYSASGTFTDRLATLHPHKVKALVSGATLDNMMLPLARHGGEDLIFPIGTSDYEAITGRPFDLTAHNQVARLIFMGEADTNNTLPYADSYGDTERRIITKLWGTEVLPRAQKLTALYGEAGGKGMLILDKGVQHGYSKEMIGYIETFLKANRDSTGPAYPIPDNSSQLMYTLYE